MGKEETTGVVREGRGTGVYQELTGEGKGGRKHSWQLYIRVGRGGIGVTTVSPFFVITNRDDHFHEAYM